MTGGTAAPQVTVRVPGLLTRFTGGQRAVTVRAETVGGSLDGVVAAYPALEPHLRDGGGRLRPHLRLFHEGSEVAPEEGAAVPLAAGDEVVVLQAVSGG